MRSKLNSLGVWLLLALPIGGVIGWMAGQLVGARKIKHSDKDPDLNNRSEGKDPPNPVTGTASSILPVRQPFKIRLNKKYFRYAFVAPALVLAAAVIVFASRQFSARSQPAIAGGDPGRGQALLQAWGCGACHTIPRVTGANGDVGPALSDLSNRGYIAGNLQNTPDNLVRWIMHPQEIAPGVAMPDAGVPEGVARDMAAYLYSVR